LGITANDPAPVAEELLSSVPVPPSNWRHSESYQRSFQSKENTIVKSSWIKSVVLAVAMAGLGGCSQSGDEMAVDAARSTYEQHDHERPAHKPSNLSDAVDELTRRFARLRAPSARDTTTELNEWRDIVRWLPELAADSDLPKAQWDQLHATAQDLAQLNEQLAAVVTERRECDAQLRAKIEAHLAAAANIARHASIQLTSIKSQK